LSLLKDVYAERTIGLVGEAGQVKLLRDAVPVPWKHLASARAIAHFEGSFAVLVAQEPFHPRSALGNALLTRVEEGMSLACIGGLPALLRPEAAAAQQHGPAATEVRALAAAHLLVAGLLPGDLSRWGGDGLTVRVEPAVPAEGNVSLVLDLPCEGDPRPVALEVRRGKGRILYCGLAAAQKLREEPVAEMVLANILRWGFSPVPAMQESVGCFGKDSDAQEALRGPGVPSGAHAARGAGVLLADESLLEGAHRAELLEVLRRGGTVVLFGLSPEGLEVLNGMMKERWERDVRSETPRLALQQAEGGQPQPQDVPRAALMAGIRPEDLAAVANWEKAEEPVHRVQAAADGEHFKALVGSGLLAKFQRDNVRIVFWQFPLRTEGDAEAQTRVLRALLTNLGVRLGPRPGPGKEE